MISANPPPDRSPLTIPVRFLPWVRLGWTLTALVSIWAFIGTLVLTRQFAANLPPRIIEGLVELGWSENTWLWFTVATILPPFIVNFVIGALIFWMRPTDRMAVFSSVFLITYGAANSFSPAREYLTAVAVAPISFAVPYAITGILSFGFLPVFFATFPDGRFYPGWMRWIALEGFIFSALWNLFPAVVGDFSGPYGLIAMFGALIMFLGSLLAQILRYRNYASPLQKQQTKWFLFGLVLIFAGLIVPSLLVYTLPSGAVAPVTSVLLDIIVAVSNLAFTFLPIAIAISILRYRLWDIDVIIRRTLQYALLTGLLALVYFGGIVILQGILGSLTGNANVPFVTVISTLGIAALFNPLRTRVQEFIDRRFYRSKFDSELLLEKFAAAARNEVDLERLTDAIINVIEETMLPDRVSLWLGK